MRLCCHNIFFFVVGTPLSPQIKIALCMRVFWAKIHVLPQDGQPQTHILTIYQKKCCPTTGLSRQFFGCKFLYNFHLTSDPPITFNTVSICLLFSGNVNQGLIKTFCKLKKILMFRCHFMLEKVRFVSGIFAVSKADRITQWPQSRMNITRNSA